MSLDSIDEGSMVGLQFNQILNVNVISMLFSKCYKGYHRGDKWLSPTKSAN